MTLTATRPDMETGVTPETAVRLALVVEYDGTNYCGSQLQVGQPTIQAELEKVLASLTGETVRLTAASRTDAGVHARGQVVSFKTRSGLPLAAFVHGLNSHLPEDIAVKSAHEVALPFDPRRMANSREYAYTILNSAMRSPLTTRFAHRVAGKLDIAAMDEACQVLIGTHDFVSFASAIGDEPDKSTIRQVHRARTTRDGEIITFTIEANAFVRHQVRSTAGALVQVGLGKMTVNEFIGILETRQPGLAGPTLPASGLCLVRVNYPFTFEEMK
jgi:tRNA pseudouridine38-40 synthase